jgi:hypothetical protein
MVRDEFQRRGHDLLGRREIARREVALGLGDTRLEALAALAAREFLARSLEQRPRRQAIGPLLDRFRGQHHGLLGVAAREALLGIEQQQAVALANARAEASRFHSQAVNGFDPFAAEREKRATITKAEGDKIAAVNLAAAAAIMEQTPGAMKLRTLQTIDGLGAGPSNTVVMFPVELTETMKKLVESLPQKNSGSPTRSVGKAESEEEEIVIRVLSSFPVASVTDSITMRFKIARHTFLWS